MGNVLKPSDASMVEGAAAIGGLDLNLPENQSLDAIVANYRNHGFQASETAKAMAEIERMLAYRLSDDPYDPEKAWPEDPAERAKVRCKIFLGYTSNMISCGMREYIRFLVQHKLVDCLVTSAGGVEEDLIKCFAKFYLGDFNLKGAILRHAGINRTGNILVPNEDYCDFEEWILPIFEECHRAQDEEGYHWTPSRLIWKLGEKINNESSIAYWAWKNQIPIFCPALTDGSLGDMLFEYSFRNPGLIVDIAGDIRAMNSQTINSPKNGVLILGGGVCKHHIMNANLFAGEGASYSVYINTGQAFDGSDTGASPDEAVSWGKIAPTAHPVKVCAEVTLVFPIIVFETFFKAYKKEPEYWDGKTYGDPHETYWTQLEFEAKDPVHQELKRKLREAKAKKAAEETQKAQGAEDAKKA